MGFLFKSCVFLMGIFCSPYCSSKHYDKDFMVKLNNNAGRTAVSQGKELILLTQ